MRIHARAYVCLCCAPVQLGIPFASTLRCPARRPSFSSLRLWCPLIQRLSDDCEIPVAPAKALMVDFRGLGARCGAMKAWRSAARSLLQDSC